MQIALTAWAALRTVLLLSPSEPSTTLITPHPQLHLLLTPTWENSIAHSIKSQLLISSPSVSPSTPFLQMIMEVGRVPSMNYTGSARIIAEDDLGSLELIVDDNQWPIRCWSTDRDTTGDVRLAFTAFPRYTTKSTPPGPRSDLRENSGGILGTGNVFVPLVIAKGSSLYEISVTWDLSETPKELDAQTVWTYGEGLTTNRLGHPSDLVNTMYAIAPSSTFHSWHDPAQPTFGLYWFTQPSPYALLSPSSLAESLSTLLPIMSTFFSTPFPSYRVFLRESPRGYGGSAFDWSFVLEWDEDVRLGKEEDARDENYFLMAHEMVHNWPTMEGAPGGQEDANATWFEEGIASYYEAILPFRSNLVTTNQFLKHINLQLSAYYTSPAIHMSMAEAAEKAWTDTHAQRAPYYRGVLYLMQLEDAIVEQGRGRSLRDPVIKLMELKTNKKPFGFPEWMGFMQEEGILPLAETMFDDMSRGNWVIPPPAGLFGEDIVPVKVRQHVYEEGFTLSVENDRRFVRDVITGSRAQLAGFEEGDEVVPGPYSKRGLDNPVANNSFTVKKVGSGKTTEIEWWPRSWHTVEAWEYRERA